MIKRIEIDSVEAGMFIHALSKNKRVPEKVFFSTIKIKNESHIKQYKRKGYRYAYIHSATPEHTSQTHEAEREQGFVEEDLEDAYVITGDPEIEPACILSDDDGQPCVGDLDQVTMSEEIEAATNIKRTARSMLANTLEEARLGKSIDTNPMKDVVRSMIDSVFRNRDALMSLVKLKDHDNYTFGHSLNVCILSISLGRQAGMERDELDKLGLSAILHDIGKMRIDPKVLNKPTRLNEEEYMQIQEHTLLGAQMLERSKDVCEEAIQVARGHHECYDGKGYPDGLKNHELHSFNQIVCIADFYDALTTERRYREAQDPTSVLRGMYRLRERKFDPILMEYFILCLGIFPVGSMVKLDTGEIAIVKSINRNNLMEQTVLIFINEKGSKYEVPFTVEVGGYCSRKIVSTSHCGNMLDSVSANAS